MGQTSVIPGQFTGFKQSLRGFYAPIGEEGNAIVDDEIAAACEPVTFRQMLFWLQCILLIANDPVSLPSAADGDIAV